MHIFYYNYQQMLSKGSNTLKHTKAYKDLQNKVQDMC